MWLGSGWANRGAVSLAQRGSGRMSGGTRGKNHGESLALLLDKHSVIGTQRVHCFYCGSQRSDAQPRGATVFRDSHPPALFSHWGGRGGEGRGRRGRGN